MGEVLACILRATTKKKILATPIVGCCKQWLISQCTGSGDIFCSFQRTGNAAVAATSVNALEINSDDQRRQV